MRCDLKGKEDDNYYVKIRIDNWNQSNEEEYNKINLLSKL